MGLVIAVYTEESFKEFIMPATDNADYSMILEKNEFGLRHDVCLDFEILNEVWRIKKGRNYRIFLDRREVRESSTLIDGQMIQILTNGRNQMILLVKSRREVFCPFVKYDIAAAGTITIGAGEHNRICYDYRRLISREHAAISRKGRDTVIMCRGSNGLYVNAKHITGQETLHFGDYINIYSLHMVFLGSILAIDTDGAAVKVNENILIPYKGRQKEKYKENQRENQKGNQKEKQTLPEGEDGSGNEAPSGKILFHRSPRIIEKTERGTVEIEEPPKEGKTPKKPLLMTIGPSFTMAIPMVLGSFLMAASSRASASSTGLLMYSGLIMALSSAVVGSFWAVANIRYQRRMEADQEAHRQEAYSRYLQRKTEEIRKKYVRNQETRLRMYPDAKTCLSYGEKTQTLWNRNETHEDYLSCRLGLGNMEFQVAIQIPKEKFRMDMDELAGQPQVIADTYRTLTGAPVLLNLLEQRLVGLVGGKEKAGAFWVSKLLMIQLAACNCYTDVKIVLIYDETNSDDRNQWEFAKWLPHVWAEDKKIRYIAADKREAGDVFYELVTIFRKRMEDEGAGPRGYEKMPEKPWFVLFLSDPALIEGELIAKYVFDQEARIGLSTIMLTSSADQLPNACEYIVENDSGFQGMYNVSAQKEDRIRVRFDLFEEKQLEAFARRLSNIEVPETESGGDLPSSLTFFEMAGISRPSDLNAEKRWLKNRSYDNIRGLIGQKAGKAPCYLDVHEKYHGPHGLVAGTTGSGKSETLQTYLLSLAINYSPDDVGFFIIDYKGGGMAHLFEGLPHLIGQISNLSGNQVFRAMVSIKSENRRRQRVFAEHGVNNINHYTKLYKNKKAAVPIPHLFIIIDEFAELKREEPDFMKELISVAQVGRSLGVHLILATQKPGGTVDDNIWSNTRFRLCLRVQDRQDSNDMLHKPDAAYLTQAGRCYLQVGNDEVYELFQSGWSGAPYDEKGGNGGKECVRLISRTGRVEMTGGQLPHAGQALKNSGSEDGGGILQPSVCCERSAEKSEKDIGSKSSNGKRGAPRTQLEAIKDYLQETAERNGYRQSHRLWLPVLPDHLYLDEFEEYRSRAFADGTWREPSGEWSLEAPIGLMDDPQNQAQLPLTVSFSRGGHYAVIGSVVTGKSTLLQTVLYALVTSYTPDYLNIYALDFGNKMMAAFEGLAHVGGMMAEGDNEKIAKFFYMLERILNERKKLFGGGNYSQYVRANGVKLPAILVVVDNFPAFNEKTEGIYEKLLIRLSKEGVGHGIFLLLSAGGFGMNEIPGRIGENLKTVLCLELPDRFSYAEALHLPQIPMMPERQVKGRGLVVYENRALEYQTALALAASDDYQRMEKISQVCEEMNCAWTGRRAQPVPEIPSKPEWEQFAALDDVTAAAAADHLLPVGYNAENAQVYSIDLSRTYCYLIAGAARTGKKNFMKVMLQSAILKESKICLIDGKGLLPGYAGEEKLSYIKNDEELFEYFQQTLTPEFVRRNQWKKTILEEGGEEEELYGYTRREQPVFLFITDLAWFFDTINDAKNREKGMKGFMETLMAKGRYHNIFFIGILNLEDKNRLRGYPVFANFISGKNGIHFGGNVSQNGLLNFDYLSFKEQARTEKAGIGWLPQTDGNVTAKKIVVPLVTRRKKRNGT